MNIAFFTNYYHPVVNGVVRSVAAFRNALIKQGHHVFVFAQSDGTYADEEQFIFRYPSLTLPLPGDIPAVIPISSFVDQLLPSLKLDVIHAHHPILLGQTAANKAADMNLPLVFTFHTQYWEYTHYVPFPQEVVQEFLKNAVHTWLRSYLSKCQHVVIPSESIKEYLVNEYGLQDGYTVIPTGTELEPFQDADGDALRRQMGWQNDKVIVSIGRLAAEKNWETLVQAVAQICQSHPDVRLVLIGDGPAKQSLETLAAELGIAERVTLTGALSFTDVPAYMRAADLFGFASVTETQGLVTLEAMAAGLPIVAVDGSGTRDIVQDGEQGILVENDASALAAAMDKVLSDPRQMRRFASRALKKSREFDINHLAKQLSKVYEQAILDKKEERTVTLRDKAKEEESTYPSGS